MLDLRTPFRRSSVYFVFLDKHGKDWRACGHLSAWWKVKSKQPMNTQNKNALLQVPFVSKTPKGEGFNKGGGGDKLFLFGLKWKSSLLDTKDVTTHVVFACSLRNVPGSQGSQVMVPLLLLYLPALQTRQALDPALEAYRPTPHWLQVCAPNLNDSCKRHKHMICFCLHRFTTYSVHPN